MSARKRKRVLGEASSNTPMTLPTHVKTKVLNNPALFHPPSPLTSRALNPPLKSRDLNSPASLKSRDLDPPVSIKARILVPPASVKSRDFNPQSALKSRILDPATPLKTKSLNPPPPTMKSKTAIPPSPKLKAANPTTPAKPRLVRMLEKVQHHLQSKLPGSQLQGFKQLQALHSHWRCSCDKCGAKDKVSWKGKTGCDESLDDAFHVQCEDVENIPPEGLTCARKEGHDYLTTSQLPSFVVNELERKPDYLTTSLLPSFVVHDPNSGTLKSPRVCDDDVDIDDVTIVNNNDVTLTGTDCVTPERLTGRDDDVHKVVTPGHFNAHSGRVSRDPSGEYVTITPSALNSHRKRRYRSGRSRPSKRVEDRVSRVHTNTERGNNVRLTNSQNENRILKPIVTYENNQDLKSNFLSRLLPPHPRLDNPSTLPTTPHTPSPGLLQHSHNPLMHKTRGEARRHQSENCDKDCDNDDHKDFDDDALTSFELLGKPLLCDNPDDTNDDRDDDGSEDSIVERTWAKLEPRLGESSAENETILRGNINFDRTLRGRGDDLQVRTTGDAGRGGLGGAAWTKCCDVNGGGDRTTCDVGGGSRTKCCNVGGGARNCCDVEGTVDVGTNKCCDEGGTTRTNCGDGGGGGEGGAAGTNGCVVDSRCSEFLGCMSFGVRGILRNKDVSGWYYLLTEDVGKKKHLQVSARAKAIVKPRSSHSIPQINRDVYGLESVTIRIERGKNGFGFTVVDEFPVRVGRVDLASPAEEAGLKPGDFVIKVNNQNVSRSTVNSVAKLVKKSGHILLLNVNRCHSTAEPDDSMDSNAPYEESDWRRADHIYESIADGTVGEKPDFMDETENKENEMTMDTRFEISSVCEPFTRDKVSASTPLVPLDSKRVGLTGKVVAAEDQKKLEAIHRLMSLELDFIDFMQLGIQRYSRPLRHRIFNVVQHNAVFQNIEKLVNISEYHVQQMQENAPSIYPESDDDSQSSEDRHFASAVAMIYYSKAHMFCQAHETYASGLSEANRVLSEMRQNEEFLHFVKHPPLEPGQPSISAFIFRPLQHIKELSSVFQEIYIHTANSSIDHATLKQVTHVLQESVHTISNMSNARVQSLTSLSSHTKSSSGKGSCTASSAASSKADSGSESGRGRKATDSLRTSASLQTVRVMDREVMKMQDRLVFSQNVPVFQLCHEDRHIIYQGDVFFLHNSHWSKIQMTLFSDMVMLCQPDKDGSLHVLCDPLYLHDICHIDTTNTHATELVLSTCPTSPYTGVPSTQSLVFRTPSPEDLSTWKTLLEHHVKKAQDHRAHEAQNLSELPPSPPAE